MMPLFIELTTTQNEFILVNLSQVICCIKMNNNSTRVICREDISFEVNEDFESIQTTIEKVTGKTL